jgi:molecular chaperone GrpE
MTERPDDEALLGQFADWLRATRAESSGLAPGEAELDAADLPEVGLGRLIEEFTALRHELKLQTRSTRGLQEETEAVLPELRRAIEQFRGVEPKEAQAAWTAGRPLAEALADLDEALERGRAEIERTRRRVIADAEDAAERELAALHARQRWPWRVVVRSYHERVLAVVREQVLGPRRAAFDALVEGYGLIQSRLRRALKAERVERIDCLGRPADPSLMTVVEVVEAPGVPPGQVVEELRPGYTWQGRVLRFAEVRAARRPAGPIEEPRVTELEPAAPAGREVNSGQTARED